MMDIRRHCASHVWFAIGAILLTLLSAGCRDAHVGTTGKTEVADALGGPCDLEAVKIVEMALLASGLNRHAPDAKSGVGKQPVIALGGSRPLRSTCPRGDGGLLVKVPTDGIGENEEIRFVVSSFMRHDDIAYVRLYSQTTEEQAEVLLSKRAGTWQMLSKEVYVE